MPIGAAPSRMTEAVDVGSMVGQSYANQPPQADVLEQVRGVMRQIRDCTMVIDAIATQFPAASEQADAARQALVEVTKAILTQTPMPEPTASGGFG